MELVKRKEYIVYLTEAREDKLMNFYKGIYRGDYFNEKHVFVDVLEIKSQPDIFMGHSGYYVSIERNDVMLFRKDIYTFHDVEKVKENGKRAIQSMEKRAVNMVLKRLVNETFEW
jgi:hypothetical protein